MEKCVKDGNNIQAYFYDSKKNRVLQENVFISFGYFVSICYNKWVKKYKRGKRYERYEY